jgi:hypothetical protein
MPYPYVVAIGQRIHSGQTCIPVSKLVRKAIVLVC